LARWRPLLVAEQEHAAVRGSLLVVGHLDSALGVGGVFCSCAEQYFPHGP
jgi:hypothetical protein